MVIWSSLELPSWKHFEVRPNCSNLSLERCSWEQSWRSGRRVGHKTSSFSKSNTYAYKSPTLASSASEHARALGRVRNQELTKCLLTLPNVPPNYRIRSPRLSDREFSKFQRVLIEVTDLTNIGLQTLNFRTSHSKTLVQSNTFEVRTRRVKLARSLSNVEVRNLCAFECLKEWTFWKQ